MLVKHKKKKHSKKKSASHKKKHAKKAPESDIKPEEKSGNKTWIWVGAVFIVLIIALIVINVWPKDGDYDSTAPIELESSLSEKVKLDFYLMSQCPYGTQVVDAIAPVKEKLGDALDLNLNFIANDNGDGTFRSLHGQPEVEGNIVQLCAIKYNPEEYMGMLTCQNKNAGAIPGNWEACASENGLEVEKIRSCFEGEEGKELLRASIAETQKVGATGSPTIYVNDEKYGGGRGENDFMRAVCNAFENERPEVCADVPEPTKVNVIILNDKRCKECDTTQLMGQLKGVFPGLVVKSYDYSDAEGKSMYQESGVKMLPAVLFDDGVKEAENYANVQGYLVEAGKYTSLRIGAAFDPSSEICDNQIDDTGNGKVDCVDETCAGTMVCREELKNHLQVFVMSDCPYGRKAIEALKEVVDNFGDKMDYEVHYIASETADGFSSLHGQYEVDEDIIQLCAKEHSPDEWLDYLYCRSTKGVRDIDWKTCGEETGIDVDAVSACFDGTEGKDLFRVDIKIAQSLSIGASPTWLANNKNQFSGITAEAVKTNFCKYNQELEGCENTLTADSGSVPAGACS